MPLTYDLEVYVGAVTHVLNLDGQRVNAGVDPLRRTDEEDGVRVCSSNPH